MQIQQKSHCTHITVTCKSQTKFFLVCLVLMKCALYKTPYNMRVEENKQQYNNKQYTFFEW